MASELVTVELELRQAIGDAAARVTAKVDALEAAIAAAEDTAPVVAALKEDLAAVVAIAAPPVTPPAG